MVEKITNYTNKKEFYVKPEGAFYVEPVSDGVKFEVKDTVEKVKIFNGSDCEYLTNKINEFIKDKIVIDIKMSAHRLSVTIMVLYKEFPF